MRQFEFPYNFDKQLLYTLQMLDPNGTTINCIYVPPYYHDYKTILRTGEQAFFLSNMTREEYENHILFINSLFPNKIQILLQRNDLLLNESICKYYINLGINKFCVGSIEQAELLKKINSKLEIIGSISMHLDSIKIKDNIENYKLWFDGFVLSFKAARDLQDIKNLPKQFYYVLLINAYCNIHCKGEHHWYHYDTNINNPQPIKCPGILSNNKSSTMIDWNSCARIRPMDLGFFDPYISIYKLQDRGWPSKDIIRDYILYTTNYSIYPNINYDERMYYQNE